MLKDSRELTVLTRLRVGVDRLTGEVDRQASGPDFGQSSGIQSAETGAAIALDLTSPANLGQVLDAIPLAMIIIDRRGTIRAFGKGAEEAFGYAAHEVVGSNISMLMSPHIAAEHDDYLANYARTGQRTVIGANRIEMARHRAGHQFPIELRVSEITLDGQASYVGFLRPIGGGDFQRGEPKAMLAELAQASRVSAMGALATAIAHELNQPLTNIANYTQGLSNLVSQQDDFKGREEVINVLKTCSDQAVRAGQLLHRLRDFVRGGQPHSEPNSVGDLVRDATALALINGYRRSVHLTNDIPGDLPLVEVDHLQGQQVVFNLVRNALEAIDAESGGHHEILIAARPAGDFVEISVEDEGPGIAPAIADSLFESFVTTKGGGMGVGLPICQKIVEAYGGTISAGKSDRLGGAAFRFTLPIAGSAKTTEA
ncbi:MAG: hypothetical protein RL339_2117 [Pseudomonadota bacterium]|jgi:two-component system sensor kinase FixL